ncbi:hypothetical protein K491DRAFT_481132 [Lophiostoma macrostomum CBS 122681]|uniref:Uncharacterized protein n=1 Tax=Lophiostoma macrostomum CBS 122681 TaxID=1314788 RepID=A0A6A6TQG1_9PLEO|nr:hypothetical protein K491DRAFT_481132 [Lophiostoma macrostomum CBS 122681]
MRGEHGLISVSAEKDDRGSVVAKPTCLQVRSVTPRPHVRSRDELAINGVPSNMFEDTRKVLHGTVRKAGSVQYEVYRSQLCRVSGNIPEAVVQRVYPNEYCMITHPLAYGHLSPSPTLGSCHLELVSTGATKTSEKLSKIRLRETTGRHRDIDVDNGSRTKTAAVSIPRLWLAR